MSDDKTSFRDRVHEVVLAIPRGQVATYGQVAHLAGAPRAARAVGNILKAGIGAPEGLPWQRVINAQGGISFKGDLSRASRQRRLLEQEGVPFGDAWTCDLETFEWSPSDPYHSVDWIDEDAAAEDA